jgi:hypothetical protein
MTDYERMLSPTEIEERTKQALQMLRQVDQNLAEVSARRREIRALNADRKKLELRATQIRREIDSGKVIEGAQVSLDMDVSLPDPFEARYPMARDHDRLHAALSVVLQGVLVPSLETLEKWHPSTGIFQGIAHWARTELAHMNAKEHPDLQLPSRMPMPEKLAELRMYIGREHRPRPRAAKVRPATGTPVRTGQGRRAKREGRK